MVSNHKALLVDYFIVVVLVMDEDRAFVKPKAILRKGQSFGELAIIHGDKRRSTVVAMEETEMLSIWFEVICLVCYIRVMHHILCFSAEFVNVIIIVHSRVCFTSIKIFLYLCTISQHSNILCNTIYQPHYGIIYVKLY